MLNIILGILQFITFLIIMIKEYKVGSMSIFMWTTLFVMFSLPHLWSILSENFLYPSEVYLQASVFVIIFNIIYIVFRSVAVECFIKEDLLGSFKDIEVESNTLRIYGRFIFITSVILFSYYFFLNLTYGSIRNTSWGDLYSNSLSWHDLGTSLSSFFFFNKYLVLGMGGSLLVYIIAEKKFLFFYTSFLILSYVIITRNRILILPMLVAIILYYMTKFRDINIKDLLLYVFLGLFSLYSIYALRLFRHYGSFNNFIQNFNFIDFNKRLVNMLLTGNGELGLRNVFLYFIYKKNNFPDFNKGHTYRRLLFLFIPTEYSLGLKPKDFAISMGSAWLGQFTNTRYSTHPTLFGDVFANFYWYGMFWSLFWMIYISFFDLFLHKNKNNPLYFVYTTVVANMYVIVARGSVYNGILFSVLSMLLYRTMYSFLVRIPKLIWKK